MDYKKYSDYMNNIDQTIINKAKNIKLLILDVDGVMTDGGIIISETNSESKKFFAQDGHGIMIIRELGIEVAIISGRYSKAVEHRGKELGFTTIIQSSRNKLLDYEKKFSNKYSLKDVCFVGDDIGEVTDGILRVFKTETLPLAYDDVVWSNILARIFKLDMDDALLI
ncbi:MAG: hypothetical protein HOJ38_06645, partial [Rhodobiaceae bacterium]|nr:hypothetical protein [Rhodobiaceae bacterium]